MNRNLDLICYEKGVNLVGAAEKELGEKFKSKDLENALRKALGVLQEDGVFAFHLYCKAEGGLCDTIRTEALDVLKNETIDIDISNCSPGEIKNLSLEQLFLAKTLLERFLTYALYHVRGMEKPKNGEEKGGDK